MMKRSKPIWGKDKNEYNEFLAFCFTFEKSEACEYSLKIAACDAYQLYLNGDFLAAGPSRAAKNHYRENVVKLPDTARGKITLVAIAAGYGVNCYEYACSEPFFRLEAWCGEKFILGTDENTEIYEVNSHVRKALRYSFQRTFTEIWRLDDEFRALLNGKGEDKIPAVLRKEKNILPKQSLTPRYTKVRGRRIGGGKMQTDENAPMRALGAPAFLDPREGLKAYPRSELSVNLYRDVCKMKTIEQNGAREGALSAGDFALYDFGINGCGFIGLRLRAEQFSEIYVLFDEVLREGEVDPLRLNCIDCVKFECEAGERCALTFEPYTFRYAKIYCAVGKIEAEDFYIREVADPRAEGITFVSDDKEQQAVFEAAVNTYRFNAVDIYMDCPSRERAGWLCDGYFTGRVERLFTGSNRIEHDFLENFLLNEKEEYIPEDMLPMCYPSEHVDGVFIPTWAMWFVLELDCYTRESGDKSLVERAKRKLYALTDFFAGYENEQELLEDLPGWVFIEWSKAAEFTNGVNYCANMLYSYMLRVLGKTYGDEKFTRKAERIAALIREKSFNGRFFTDHAVRENGKLCYCPDTTEVCQYYAFFTDVATPQTYPALWDTLLKHFGPSRKTNNEYPEIWFANAFIGNYLRLSLLERYGLYEKLMQEIGGYFAYMADKTGTLWENDTDFASCNHGFASYAARWQLLCLAGYKGTDVDKKAHFTSTYSKNISCKFSLPLPDGGKIEVDVSPEGRNISLPKEYETVVD